ncbi:cAMP-dependent protein kinase inhibitor gamma [Parasteatoda tepidariorum]|uniref:cAMP-dependent protein kinase inhibitor gamma n=1 Tax=Parasteatoda tepidariorum TaxID=114398 RepID=UPI00077F9303|nr:cAMP-dependent protein kinase inhibitor gamma [Parasteatoda tepidariorum]XP_042905829.1 cAMP-dependent protein kinase inhibitor gamma [Parasteatoda tepidariorum]
MAMEVESAATSPAFDDFLQTGRTGRRNAMPDIRAEGAAVSTASLPDSLQKLSCSDLQMDGSCGGEGSGSGQIAQGGAANT